MLVIAVAAVVVEVVAVVVVAVVEAVHVLVFEAGSEYHLAIRDVLEDHCGGKKNT